MEYALWRLKKTSFIWRGNVRIKRTNLCRNISRDLGQGAWRSLKATLESFPQLDLIG
jgi:hypothetical protein